MTIALQTQSIQLVPADESLAEQLADYYRRNRAFLKAFEPVRNREFFTADHQQSILREDVSGLAAKTSFRFYIRPVEQPQIIIGTIGLSNVVWGAFCSAFLGYKLDQGFINKGYMSAAVGLVVQYAFEELRLHRIEANVMPKNKASLRVLEKNHFVNEGTSKHYLNIDGVWEDHIHMVRINYGLH